MDVDGAVILDDEIADHFELKAGGDVSRKDGTRIDAKELVIDADGDIGSKDMPIETDSDHVTAKGGNVYINNKSADLIVDRIIGKKVEIKTDGSIDTAPDGKITAKDLRIDARDDIGTSDAPIRLNVSGKVQLSSLRGHVYYIARAKTSGHDAWNVLIDCESKIKVGGYFSSGAYLEVINTNHLARLMYEALLGQLVCECERLTQYSAECTAWHDAQALQTLIDEADCDGCGFLWKLIDEGKTLYDFALGIFSSNKKPYDGTMVFTLELEALDGKSAEQLEDETLYVLCCVDGEVICIETTVEDGCISFKLDALGEANLGYTQFAILDAETFDAMWQAGEIPAQTLQNDMGQTIKAL